MASIGIRLALATTAMTLVIGQSAAKSHHRQAAVDAAPSPTAPHSFYPNETEGGVRGNLPFNNQIRKHTDPLSANGGK